MSSLEKHRRSRSDNSRNSLDRVRKKSDENVPPNSKDISPNNISLSQLALAEHKFTKSLPVASKTNPSSVKKVAATDRPRRKSSPGSPFRREWGEKRDSDSNTRSSSTSSMGSKETPMKQQIIEKNRLKARSQQRKHEDTTHGSVIRQLGKDDALITAVEKEDSTCTTEQIHEQKVILCLKKFAFYCDTLSIEILANQFASLPIPQPKEYRVCKEPGNIIKNRYTDIPCLDSTRIHLKFLRPEVGVGYIHANRVEYPTLRNYFIITQGPISRTVPDFWRMIWQENVEFIAMLCKTVESGKRKCAEYFSSQFNVPLIFASGLLHVTLIGRHQEEDLTISTIQLVHLKEARIITHYQWAGWQDCRAPSMHVHSLFTLLRHIRGSRFPVVVHCSAGVGRSGTMVALEMCLMTIANEKMLDVHAVVSSLRRYRAKAVQTLDQYLSIFRLVLQFGEQNGCISREDVCGFYNLYQNYIQQ